MTVRAQTMMMSNPADVLNYALTLEHLEYAFYRDGLARFPVETFRAAGFAALVHEMVATIRDDEKAHVDALTAVVTQLGGTPVEEAEYDFGYDDLAGFLATAMALENTGVSAYQGAAGDLIDVTAVSKGKGFAGAMKRHGFKGQGASHGAHRVHRKPGSIGQCATPARVFKRTGSSTKSASAASS